MVVKQNLPTVVQRKVSNDKEESSDKYMHEYRYTSIMCPFFLSNEWILINLCIGNKSIIFRL